MVQDPAAALSDPCTAIDPYAFFALSHTSMAGGWQRINRSGAALVPALLLLPGPGGFL